MSELPPPTTSPREFLEQWLPKAFAEAEVPEAARQVEVTVGVRLIGDAGGDWLFHLRQGELRVEPGSVEEAAFSLIQTVEDWRGSLWEGQGGAFGRQASALFRPGLEPGGAGGGAQQPAGPAALAQLQALRGVIRMLVTGGSDGDWKVDFKLGPGPVPAEPTTTVTMTAEDATALGAGQLDPMTAFMSGRMQVAGDMTLLLQMQAIQMQAAQAAST